MKKVSSIFSLVLILSIALSSVLFAQTTTEGKKWSPQAKGAVIGGATGAAAGAIINKRNRVVGGAVGAVAGAGVGYGVGKIIDNKQKKKAAEEQQRMAELNSVASASNTSYNGGRSYASSTTRHHSTKKSTAKVTAPVEEVSAVQPAYMQMGWIPNEGPADPMVAYSNAEYKRKSW